MEKPNDIIEEILGKEVRKLAKLAISKKIKIADLVNYVRAEYYIQDGEKNVRYYSKPPKDEVELCEMLRDIIKIAIAQGIKSTDLANYVKSVYRDFTRKREINLKTDEPEFAKKVKEFLKCYGNQLFYIYYDVTDGLAIKKKFIKNMYYTLWGMKILIQEKATKLTGNELYKLVGKYYEGNENDFYKDLNLLYNFFYICLTFPEGTETFYGVIKNPEFIEFCEQYNFRRSLTSKTALAAVWFIDKYF